MHERDGFSAKPSGKSLFHLLELTGPTGQFWQMESVLRVRNLLSHWHSRLMYVLGKGEVDEIRNMLKQLHLY